MNLIEQSRQALTELHALTIGFADGRPPDPLSVLGYQSRVSRLYGLLAEEISRKFGAKERARLQRKLDEANAYMQRRRENLTGKDSEQLATEAVRQQHEEEINRMEEFVLYQKMLDALRMAFEHSRSTVSFLKEQERSHDPNDLP